MKAKQIGLSYFTAGRVGDWLGEEGIIAGGHQY